jgi:hypothetical protein
MVLKEVGDYLDFRWRETGHPEPLADARIDARRRSEVTALLQTEHRTILEGGGRLDQQIHEYVAAHPHRDATGLPTTCFAFIRCLRSPCLRRLHQRLAAGAPRAARHAPPGDLVTSVYRAFKPEDRPHPPDHLQHPCPQLGRIGNAAVATGDHPARGIHVADPALGGPLRHSCIRLAQEAVDAHL